jgi:DNA-binding NarL/FixJ family response regulator
MLPTIILAEDHTEIRERLKAFLQRRGMTVVGVAGDGAAAVQLAASLLPDVALLDVSMPIMNGIDAASEMRIVAPGTKTIMLTMQSDSGCVGRAARAGAAGYVLKTRITTELIDAIHDVLSGILYVGDGISRAAFETRVQAAGWA